MREIKFRAFQDNHMVISPISSNYGLHRFFGYLYEDAPLMQFTGLLDANSKEIYEGDILKLIVYKNIGKHSIRTVSFDKGCFGIIDTTGAFWPLGIVVGNKGNEKIFEVIGNIYENGELLGGQYDL